jgi:hypothetical protein
MLNKKLIFMILSTLIINTYCIGDENNFELILGQWYGASNQFQEIYDTVCTFTLTKNGDIYSLKYAFGNPTPYFITVTGILQNESDINYIVFLLFTENTKYKFQIRPNSFEVRNGKINTCTLISDIFIDYWPFIKKSDLIKKLIPDLSLPKKFAQPELIGFINDNGVRLRDNYGLSSTILKTLRKNESVSILDMSPRIEVIDGYYEYWYKILTQDRITGWVYGAFLELDGNEMLKFVN